MSIDFDRAVEAAARNGTEHDGPAVQPTPIHKMSALPTQGRRTQQFNLPAPYKGYSFVAWINFPKRLAEDFSSDDRQVRNEAFSRVILSHNGWPDPETGEELPQWEPGDVERFREFCDAIPQELFLAMQACVGSDVGNVAGAVQEQRKRR